MRRAFDITSSLVLGIALLPLALSVAVVILLDTGRPILFLQPRVGKGGRAFTIVKFRSMVHAPPGTPAPERTTAIGRFLRRFSLDELPELLNVLNGDMSLIGPRPLLKIEQPRDLAVRRRRQSVRPGITGLAQVDGRNTITAERKFALDLKWIATRSVAGDALILFSTIFCVIFLAGQHRAEGATRRRPVLPHRRGLARREWVRAPARIDVGLRSSHRP